MTNYSLDKFGNKYASPADLRPTNVDAANAAGKTDPNAFKVERSGLAVIANGKYQFAFSYYYQDPNNPSQLISGPRSANFVVNLQAPDYTVAVSNLTVTPGLLLYGVKWDALDKSLSTNKWFIDAQIYESLTGSFTGEEYLVWSGTGNSATILVSNTNNRWIRVDTRDQDYHKKSVVYGPFKATDPITVDTVGPSNVTSVSVSSGIDTSGYLGFNAYADISWPAVTGGGIRGYRIRFSNDNGATYSYVNSPGTGTTYRLGGLAIGSTYKIAVATYDEYNNTSSSYISGTDVTVTGTPSVSSYISGGPFQFGVGVGSVATNKGLYFDASNYWYVNATNSARLKLGGASNNYLLWDGSTFEIDGNVTARGGTFSGNLLMSTTGASIYNGTIDANSNLSGNGFVLNSTGLKVANGTKSVTISAATGTITANGGSIGQWNITDTTLSKNNIILDSAGQIQVGSTSAQSVYLKSSGSYVMWAGNNTPDANAKFRVASDGTLYASNAIIGGYATSSELTTVNGTATTASTAAQTAATDANTAKVAALAAKATADAALPSTSFNRDAIVNSINSTTTTTTINGGKITTGTISANAVVADFISAFTINANKVTTGTISGVTADFVSGRIGGFDLGNGDFTGVLTRLPRIMLGSKVLIGWNGGSDYTIVAGNPYTDAGQSFFINTQSNVFRFAADSASRAYAAEIRNTVRATNLRYITGLINDSSSRRFKENITYLPESYYKKILDVKPAFYTYIDNHPETDAALWGTHAMGPIAEDLEEAGLGFFVERNLNGEPTALRNEHKLAYLLIPLVKEMKEKIDSLETRLIELENANV